MKLFEIPKNPTEAKEKIEELQQMQLEIKEKFKSNPPFKKHLEEFGSLSEEEKRERLKDIIKRKIKKDRGK